MCAVQRIAPRRDTRKIPGLEYGFVYEIAPTPLHQASTDRQRGRVGARPCVQFLQNVTDML